jgi:aminopeptidase
MQDLRQDKLARILVGYCTRIQPEEKVLIEATDAPDDMVITVVRAVREAGWKPLVAIKRQRIIRELLLAGDVECLQAIAAYEANRLNQVDAYIAVRGSENILEWSDIPRDAMRLYDAHWFKPVHLDIRLRKKWVILRWPLPSMAQQAGISTEAFEDLYFEVCTMDYEKMRQAVKPLSDLKTRTDQVQITGPGTDITFSIKDMRGFPCTGGANIPGGECFTAPVRDSVSGVIRFNTATLYHGQMFNDVCLKIEQGKIIEATSNKTPQLNSILDTDEGAQYIAEFALGFNPFLTRPILDTLFDEKIAGSFHFTPGQPLTDNGNRSAVHGDMVVMQTPEYGGGTIVFA